MGAANERWIKDQGLHRAPEERHPPVQPSIGTHGIASQDAHPEQQDADGSSMPLVKKSKESGEPEIPTNPPPPTAPARNLTCC